VFSAEGYFDADQEVSGDRGVDVPVNLPLRDKPALVTVEVESGADVFVDGRIVATTPVGRPIEVAPGGHVIALAKNGRQPWSQDVVLEHGKPFKVAPRLVTSGQRILAYTMLGAGGASLILGGLFALGSVGAERDARDIEAKRAKGNISPKELADHNKLIDQRDSERTAAIVFGSVGAAAAIGGALFYTLDKPPVALLPPGTVEPQKKLETPADVAASLRPLSLFGPGLIGGGVMAKF